MKKATKKAAPKLQQLLQVTLTRTETFALSEDGIRDAQEFLDEGDGNEDVKVSVISEKL